MFKRVLSLMICILTLVSCFVSTGIFSSANTAIADEIMAQTQTTITEKSVENTSVPVSTTPQSTNKNSSSITSDIATATYSGTCGDNLTWSLNTSSYVLSITGTGDMYDYINTTVGTGISLPPWKTYMSRIRSVIIADSVTSIGNYAFYDCTSLASITIPDSVTFVGTKAFNNTAYYNNSENWIDNVLYVGKHLINANSSVPSNCSIKDGTLTIANYAFYKCTSLTSITIPNSVVSIGEYAFNSCTALTGISIPNSVIHIGRDAFRYCSSLANVSISDSVINIGGCAFGSTAYYNNSDNWIDNVLYIDNHLIDVNIYISGSCHIKDGTITIANNAFEDCSSLNNIIIPDSVTNIGDYAFGNCYSLTSITIPDSVLNIGEEAFQYCYATIKCYETSYAHNYAISNSIEYTFLCRHSFTVYISDNNATCIDGTKTAYCDKGCGTTDTITDEGSALGHTWTE